MGPAFQFKCLLSPVLKFNIFRTYVGPVLRSGLSSFALSSRHTYPLAIFHRKILRGILNFSKHSNIAPLYFLLGELPIEGQIHLDVFSLFYSVWINPESKVHQTVKYLLQNSSDKSKTWSIFVRQLSQKYGMIDPLDNLKKQAPSKAVFKEYVTTKISAHYENELRVAAKNNSRMKYLNISLTSLRGRPHSSLKYMITSHEVRKARIHLKMLAGDFLTYEVKSSHSGGSAHCRVCIKVTKVAIIENLEHILTSCVMYDDIRERIYPCYDQELQSSKSKLELSDFSQSNETLCQFLLDPTSLNLKFRLTDNDPTVKNLFNLSRDLCFAISKKRTQLLASLITEK